MAAQRKKHTADQMRGITTYQQMKECPSCGETRFRVIETRRQQDAQRRRYKCDICGHRETRYELNQKNYEEFVKLRRNFKVLSKIFISHTASEALKKYGENEFECRCLTCGFYAKSSGYCSLEIPECGTSDANDCSSYIKDN